MTVRADLLALCQHIDTRIGLPAVTHIHVPATAAGGKDGEFCAIGLADGSVGTSFVLLGDTLARLLSAGRLGVPRPAGPLLAGLLSSDPAERALGMATANAVAQSLFTRAGYAPDYATNSLGSLDLGPGDRLGMVGFFPPLVRQVGELGIPLTVVELKADLVREEPGLSVTLDPSRLRECNKIVCTSTVLLNDTLDDLLDHARHASQFVLIGPGAGGLPDPLFARGVTVMGGTRVHDATQFFDRCGKGESWGDAARKYCIAACSSYPGVEALLDAAARHGARL